MLNVVLRSDLRRRELVLLVDVREHRDRADRDDQGGGDSKDYAAHAKAFWHADGPALA